MIFTASRGQAFTEEFTFKNDKGQAQPVPLGKYVLTLERGGIVKEFSLRVQRTRVLWVMSAADTQALEYSDMYFALNFNGQEIARGVLRVK